MGAIVNVGYKYYMGLHFGLCYGPVDELLEIRAGDRTAWSGSVTTSSTVFVNAPELFGGDEREGGVAGDLEVMMGEPSQAPNAYLTTVQGATQPAYRGILGAVFHKHPGMYVGAGPASNPNGGGLIGSMNPYIKPWAFRVRRILQGWRTPVFAPTKAVIDLGGGIKAMNGAHIIYQCLTDPEWGMGYPPSQLNATKFQACADQLFSEGLGLCIVWRRQDKVENFIDLVSSHIGAQLQVEVDTGLFALKLIRDDYTPATLPRFNEDNILELREFQRASIDETINEVTVKYTDTLTGKPGSVTVQDLANIRNQGGIVAQTRNYPGAPTSAIAARLAARDQKIVASMLSKAVFVANRSAYGILPGDPFRFSWAARGVADMVMRAGKVNYGNLAKGEILIEAAEDVFGLPNTSYVAIQPTGWTEPVTAAVAAPAVRMLETTYRDVVATLSDADIAALPADPALVVGVAKAAGATPLAVELQTKVGAAPYTTREQAPFTPHGTLVSSLSRTATSIVLSGNTSLEQIVVGDPAIIDDEIVRVDAVDTTTATITIARGCVDTIPALHSAGATFWAYGSASAADPTRYLPSETIDGRFITLATGGRLADASGPLASVTTTGRYKKPYPPGDLQINGTRYPSAPITGALVVSWQHRDRITQDSTVVDTLATSVGPEAGVTYTLEFYDATNTLRRTVTGLTGTTRTWTEEVADCGSLQTSVRIRLWSVRAAIASHQVYDYTVTR